MAELEVKGLAQFRSAIENLPGRLVKNVLKSALRQSANVVKDEAKRLVPIKAGALKASIRVIPRRGSPTRVQMSVVAGELTDRQKSKFGQKSAFYALFVEKGTAKMPPHPFMRPALESKAQEALAVLVQTIGEKLPGEMK